MARYRNLSSSLSLFAGAFVFAGCYAGPTVNGSFARTFSVSGPIRLELSNTSGDVDITEGAAGTVSINGEVRASGFGFENTQKRLDEIVSNPPIEQRGDTIRIRVAAWKEIRPAAKWRFRMRPMMSRRIRPRAACTWRATPVHKAFGT